MIKFINKKIRAFSVAEAVLAVFVTILCINLLVNLLGNVKSADKHHDPINNVAMSYVQLERFLKDDGPFEVDLKNSASKQVMLKHRIGEKDGEPVYGDSYYLEHYKNMIRMRKSGAGSGGHMPLVLNISKASFSHGEDYFRIHLTETDKRKSTLTFKTEKPLPKKKKDDNKDKNKKKDKTSKENKNHKKHKNEDEIKNEKNEKTKS